MKHRPVTNATPISDDDLVLAVLGEVYPLHMKAHPENRQGLVFVIERKGKKGDTDFDVKVVVTTIDELLGTDKLGAEIPEAHATVLLAASESPFSFGVLYLTEQGIGSYEILHTDVASNKDGASPVWIAPAVPYHQ